MTIMIVMMIILISCGVKENADEQYLTTKRTSDQQCLQSALLNNSFDFLTVIRIAEKNHNLYNNDSRSSNKSCRF